MTVLRTAPIALAGLVASLVTCCAPSLRADAAGPARPYAPVQVGVEQVVRVGDGALAVSGPVFGVYGASRWGSVGGQLHLDLLEPSPVPEPVASVDRRGWSARLGLAALRPAASPFGFTAEIGPGVDMVRYRAASIATDERLRPTAGGVSAQPFVYLSIGLRVEIDPVNVFVQGLLVVELTSPEYDVQRGNQSTTVLAPSLLQPGIVIGAGW